MNTEEFQRHAFIRNFAAEKLPAMVRDRLTDCQVEDVYSRDTRRNNGQQLLGLYVKAAGRDLAPCIYVEPYIPPDPSMFQLEGTWDRIADRIAEDFRYALDVLEPQAEELYRPEDIEEHLILKLVNHERNEALLESYPHRDVLDLSALLEWEVVCGRRRGMIHVSQEVLDEWGCSFDDMYETALMNTMRKYPERIEPLGMVLEELTEGRLQDEESPFYYIGTERGLQGAVAILYPDVLSRIYDRIGEPYYMIPSSINEMLALPCSFEVDPTRLRNLIWEVNAYMLDKSEILSDSVYLYNPEQDQLELIGQDG